MLDAGPGRGIYRLGTARCSAAPTKPQGLDSASGMKSGAQPSLRLELLSLAHWVHLAASDAVAIDRGQLVNGSSLCGSLAFGMKASPDHRAIKRGSRLAVECVPCAQMSFGAPVLHHSQRRWHQDGRCRLEVPQSCTLRRSACRLLWIRYVTAKKVVFVRR